mmetsp:Transcript_24379/g.34092  ORF Transcript_24379/g.34092 Transcript_24379/m.34092 type:complete len:86 (+) Transcript_24379:512-769(+)
MHILKNTFHSSNLPMLQRDYARGLHRVLFRPEAQAEPERNASKHARALVHDLDVVTHRRTKKDNENKIMKAAPSSSENCLLDDRL